MFRKSFLSSEINLTGWSCQFAINKANARLSFSNPGQNEIKSKQKKILPLTKIEHTFLEIGNSNLLNNLNQLEILDTRFNPISLAKDYRSLCISKKNTLIQLDGVFITSSERLHVFEENNWSNYFNLLISDQNQSFRPLSIRTSRGQESSSLEHYY